MEKNKLIIGIITVIVLVVGGIAAFYFIQPEIRPEEPVVNDVADPIDPRVEEIIAPKAILIGNMSNTSLPVEVRKGYVATFDIYREDKLVGTIAWKRVEEGKTKCEHLLTEAADMPRPKRSTAIIKHDAALIVQRMDGETTGGVFVEPFRMAFVFDREKYKTIIIVGEIETGGVIQDPTAFERIDLRELKIGWRREFPARAVPPAEPIPGMVIRDPEPIVIEVIEETTVTVPAGTFDVLRVRITEDIIDTIVYYYITADGRLVKMSSRGDVSKLRSYSPAEI